MNLFTAFSGYDSQCLALDRLRIDYDLVGWSEIDKYAIQAHNALYPQYADRNLGDISKIDWKNFKPNIDLFTFSFPCTDISNAGKQEGLSEGSGTRSSLLWECRKAIEIKRPKYLLMENVKALTQKKFLPYLHKWLRELEEFGYSNYTKVLNAKDFGVPQNRKRVFVVSILGDEHYEFPKGFKLDKRLLDVLEKEVDDKYYLSQKLIDCFLNRNLINKEKGNGFKFEIRNVEQIAKTITSRNGTRADNNYIYRSSAFEHSNLILSYTRDAKGKILNYHTKDIANTIHTSTGSGGNTDQYVIRNYSISKLTPTEVFRLMGVGEREIQILLNAGISNTQLYKMAGNSIVVDVLYYILKNLFVNKQLKDTLFND
jgi:DNA (cytosine-5)-methyltransferase 1